MKLTFDKLRNANMARGKEWGDDDQPLGHKLCFRGTEMAGESGEACNIIKKIARELYGHKGGKHLNSVVGDLAEELADVVISADRIAELIGIDLGLAVKDKFNKTSEKHGFSTMISNPSSSDVDRRS